MKKSRLSIVGITLCALLFAVNVAFAQGTAFTYQGRLNASGSPANGPYDMTFNLYNVSSGGSPVTGPVILSSVGVTNGLFTVTVDFSTVWATPAMYWLDISVRPSGNGTFNDLAPRQQVTPTPYAIYAETAGSAGSSGGWNLTGNSGTSPGTDFLGPTDNVGLQLKANGVDALFLQGNPSSGSVNISGGYWSAVGNGTTGVTDFGGGSGGANFVYANYGSLSGGFGNSINTAGIYGVIPGGSGNVVDGAYGFAAGFDAQAEHSGAFVWSDASGGAFASTAANQFSVRATGGVRFVTGGAGMTIDGVAVSTGGGGGGSSGWGLSGNAGTTPGVNFLGTTDDAALELHVNGTRALRLEPGPGNLPNLNAGVSNSTSAAGASTVAGGVGNTASAVGSFVGGGGYDGTTFWGNTASGPASTIGGGIANNAFYYATVGGGWGNSAGGYYSAVVGGYSNNASSSEDFVGGGGFNTASGGFSMVPGGLDNTASGAYSFAAGDTAKAVNNGAFVWADASSGTPFSSTVNNQFNVRATGGVRFVTGGAGMTIDGVPVSTGGSGGGGPTNAWLTTGNAGANPANGYYLGTSDTNGLELAVNGVQGMRLDYASASSDFPISTTSGINVTGGFWGNANSSGVIGGTIAGGGYSFVSGFDFLTSPNTVTGNFGTVGGGNGNTAGYEATVPGGVNNSAIGTGSFAAGVNAHAYYNGSFVWGDGTQQANSTGPDRFEVLASGGVNFYTSGGETMSINNAEVGINTSTPSQALEVNGAFMMVDGVQGTQAYIGNGGTGNDVEVGSLTSGITAVSMYNHTDNAYMHVYCSSITIEGGSDLAEPFKFSKGETKVPQGAVVVIDDANPGQLKMSDQPYDTRVAGVVSGANGISPGIQMQQQGLLEGGKNVALTGRVYVQADATNGAIKPGDLLTTSSTPGHAMKVTDHGKAQGAILGKAMTGLKEGQGMILVLVTLQ